MLPFWLEDAGLPESGAGNEARTRDLNLGKVALYQLSYSRAEAGIVHERRSRLPARADGRVRVSPHEAARARPQNIFQA